MHPTDKLTVAHIFNLEKSYLPFDMQPEALKQKYESLTIGIKARVDLWWHPTDSKITTKEQMLKLAEKAQASIVVVGMNGRKGPKEDKTVLGSAVQFLAINTVCPVLIVKDENGLRSKKHGGKFRVAVCSDGSEKSIKALNFMTRLMDRRRGDQLMVICVKTSKCHPDDVSDNVNHYFSAMDEVSHGITRFITLNLSGPTDTVDKVIC